MTNSRATCRAGHRCEPKNDREAWHCQVMHAADPLEAIAAKEGINPHTLAAMVNPDRDDTWLPSRRHASILDRTKDNDAVVRFYAERAEGLFFRPPTVVAGANSALMTAIADQTKQLGEAVAAIDKALRSQNAITTDELPELEREIDDIAVSAMRLKSTVKLCAVPAATPHLRKVSWR